MLHVYIDAENIGNFYTENDHSVMANNNQIPIANYLNRIYEIPWGDAMDFA